MTRRDPRDNPVSTDSAAALDASERALWRMMSFYGAPLDDLDAAIAADPAWRLPRLMKAGFLLSLTEPALVADARIELDAAVALGGAGNDRERGHAGALRALVDGDWEVACARWQAVLDAHPRDALALQWSHLFDFYRGDVASLEGRVARALPHWSDADPLLPLVRGLHAFGLEEGGRYAEAEATGRAVLERDARVPWAIHAVGHVMEMQGRHAEGWRWIDAARPQWAEGNGFACHLAWHQALFALEALDRDAVLAVFDAHLGPAVTEITLQRLDAASLLWRCGLVGIDVGTRWRALVDGWNIEPAQAGFSTFNDLHAVLALVGAGELARAAAYVEAAAAAAERSAGSNRAVMHAVGAPLLRGLLAFGAGRFAAATRLLAPLVAHSVRIGGSHAQRDVIEQTLLAAAVHGGDLSFARSLVQARQRTKPATPLTHHWTRSSSMPTSSLQTQSRAIPALRYRDAPAAIDWLCRVFGFERHLVVPGPDDTIAHAQLTLGGGMIMLGSASNGSALGERIRQPDEIGGFETQSAYLVVADADAVYARVRAAGGSIVIDIKDEDYGGRGFSCTDLEGRLWSVGSYDPWAESA
jgi:uncharacterized glyoxalase superfamily protein PhnB